VLLTSHVIQDMEQLVDEVLFIERGGRLLATSLADFRRSFRCYRLPRASGNGKGVRASDLAAAEGIKNVEERGGHLDLFSFADPEAVIRAVAMGTDYRPIDRYTHRMSRAERTAAHRVYEALFPFTLHLDARSDGYLRLAARPGGIWSLIGLLASLAGFACTRRLRCGRRPEPAALALVAATGIYGWIAAGFIGAES
jgi:hypothetical protein